MGEACEGFLIQPGELMQCYPQPIKCLQAETDGCSADTPRYAARSWARQKRKASRN